MKSRGLARSGGSGREPWGRVWARLVAAAEEAYPLECCGLVTWDDAEGLRTHPGSNLARVPGRFRLDPGDLIRLMHRYAGTRAEVVLVYHSHPDGDPVLSTVDRRRLAPAGQPWLPAVRHVVLSVRSGRLAGAGEWAWDGRRRGYVPVGDAVTLLRGPSWRPPRPCDPAGRLEPDSSHRARRGP